MFTAEVWRSVLPFQRTQTRNTDGPLASYFTDFLQRIRPTDSDRQAFIAAHTGLRQLLMADQQTARLIVSIFLQGSYRRATAIRAYQGHQPDVDVVVATRLFSQEYWLPEGRTRHHWH